MTYVPGSHNNKLSLKCVCDNVQTMLDTIKHVSQTMATGPTDSYARTQKIICLYVGNPSGLRLDSSTQRLEYTPQNITKLESALSLVASGASGQTASSEPSLRLRGRCDLPDICERFIIRRRGMDTTLLYTGKIQS